MPIFLPRRSAMRLNSGFAISEKTMRLVAPTTSAMFAPFWFACTMLSPFMNEKPISPARIAWMPRELDWMWISSTLSRPYFRSEVRALLVRLHHVEPVHEREADLAGEDRLDAARARLDVDQLDVVEAVLLEELFLLCHVQPALRAGDGGPVDADFLLLRPRGRREREDEEEDRGENWRRFHACPV